MKNFFKLIIFTAITTNAQVNFNKGFNIGYGEGYCYEKGIGCIKPLPPVAPIPTINENINSYQDGYNRGFQQGLNTQKSNNNSATTKQQYKTSQPRFLENNNVNPYVNINSAIELALALRESKGRAIEYLKNKDYQAVADICFAGLNVSPKDDEFMLLLAQVYRDSGDNKNALKWYKKAYYYRKKDKNLKTLIQSLENEIYNNN